MKKKSAAKNKGKSPRFAILKSRFNAEVTNGLLCGAIGYLAEEGIHVSAADQHEAPGAFEIPLLAKALAKKPGIAGVICLGCVIKGDTAHFEFISLGATIGIQQVALETGKPISFGILTTYDDAQALARSRADAHNKGREAAAACLDAHRTLAKLA